MSTLITGLSAQLRAALPALTSKTYEFDKLPVREGAQNRSRPILDGITGGGVHLEAHHTELPAGKMPHAAHKHVHEEMLMLREGTLEVTIEDKVTTIGPGGIIYVASNEMHGWRNIGNAAAHYTVLTLRKPPAA